MISDALQKARDFEEQYSAFILPEERPLFHLTPRIGWMNDPNGFSLYQGKVHLFYQYHPYSTMWGPMHWGHAVSTDLLHWDYLPAAIAPDQPYDKAGCFSGSAIELDDGRQLLMYTGVKEKRREDGIKKAYQTQCLAFGDGENYIKYEKNPILGEKDVPEGFSIHDFRDPKIGRRPDGGYACIIGNRSDDKSGARSTGISGRSSTAVTTSTARCGNARICSNWTTGMSFWSVPRTCARPAWNSTTATAPSA